MGVQRADRQKQSIFSRISEIIWDGPRSPEEKKLIRKLDIYLMTWATYGYFIRLLDSGNVTNAYVSGMKEDLNFHGNQFNLLTTFFNVGYICSQVPSQLLLTRLRPSYYLPTAELLWSIVTFCFAAVQSVEQVYALRFIIGCLESPFAVGVLTVMGNYYTPRELAKRIAIFYSACYAAAMFSGYLQAAIYNGMHMHLGLAGWRWLFIFCGIISLPGAFYGYYAVPDNPYRTRAPWIKPEQRLAYIARMEQPSVDRRKPVPLSWRKIRTIFSRWRIYALTLTLIAHCVATQPLNYFPIWLKSLDRFSVYQINLLPTAAQALALVTTLTYSWVSDALGGARWQIMLIPAVLNLTGMLSVLISSATTGNYGATFFGYFINAASWGYWPLVFAWANEFCGDDAEERAIAIGVAQSFGLAFTAWLPVVVLNVGKYAPRFTLGFAVMTGFSVLELGNVFMLRWFVNRDEQRKLLERQVYEEDASDGENFKKDASGVLGEVSEHKNIAPEKIEQHRGHPEPGGALQA